MASSTLFKLRRRRSISKFAGELYDEEILKEFRGAFAKAVKKSYEDLVKDWSSKPRFVVRAGKSSAGRYFWNIRVEGSDKAKKRWLMVDREGRAGGTVISRKGPQRNPPIREGGKGHFRMMRFKEYYPKTLPRTKPSNTDWDGPNAPVGGPPRISLGGGGAIGPSYYRAQVVQGAVEPRRFTELVIEPAAAEEFKKAGRRAYQRVRRKFRSG